MLRPDDPEETRKRRLRNDARTARDHLDQFRELRARLKRGETLEPDLARWLENYDEGQQRRDARMIADYQRLVVIGII